MLVAISIPIFTAQLEKSRIATDEANVRGWYAQQVANYISEETTPSTTYPSDGFPALKAAGASVSAEFDADNDSFTVTYSADKLDENLVIGGTTSSSSSGGGTNP